MKNMGVIVDPTLTADGKCDWSISSQQICAVFGNQQIITVKDVILYMVYNARCTIVRNITCFAIGAGNGFALIIAVDRNII